MTPFDVSRHKSHSICPAACCYAKDKHEMLVEAQDNLKKAQFHMKNYVDLHRHVVEFNVGDSVAS